MKRKHLIANDHNRTESTDFTALSAQGAFVHVDNRHRNGYGFARLQDRLHEDVAIGLLHVTIQQLCSGTEDSGKAGGDSSLAGPPFSAGYAYDHVLYQ
jgi:hypothetical protein